FLISALMPTFCRPCCSASAALTSLGRSVRAEITVLKPFGLPQAASSSLALAKSPWLPGPDGYGLMFWLPGISGISRCVAMSPPVSGPPNAVCIACLSVAYSTALRQCGLSNGGTDWEIAVYQSRAVGAASAFFLYVGFCWIRDAAAACTP